MQLRPTECDCVRSTPFSCNHFRVISGIIRQQCKLFHLSRMILYKPIIYVRSTRWDKLWKCEHFCPPLISKWKEKNAAKEFTPKKMTLSWLCLLLCCICCWADWQHQRTAAINSTARVPINFTMFEVKELIEMPQHKYKYWYWTIK